jgi:hypothetical protein
MKYLSEISTVDNFSWSIANYEEGRDPTMSIMKITQTGVINHLQFKSKWTTLANAFLLSIIMLAALDLFLASIREDTLSNFTMYVLTDIILTVIVIIFSSDLIAKGRESLICFLAYMLFLWVCITILKLMFL